MYMLCGVPQEVFHRLYIIYTVGYSISLGSLMVAVGILGYFRWVDNLFNKARASGASYNTMFNAVLYNTCSFIEMKIINNTYWRYSDLKTYAPMTPICNFWSHASLRVTRHDYRTSLAMANWNTTQNAKIGPGLRYTTPIDVYQQCQRV